MKKLYLIILPLVVSSISLAQYQTTNTFPSGVPFDWFNEAAWVIGNDPRIPVVENQTKWIEILTYIDLNSGLSFNNQGNLLRIGTPSFTAPPSTLSSYDILVIRGDLLLNKGPADNDNGFTIHPNGILIVLGDVQWNRNKAFVANNGILVITGNLQGATQSANNVYSGSGLVFQDFTDQLNAIPGPSIVDGIQSSSFQNNFLDITTDLCSGDVLISNPGGVTFPEDILAAICDFINSNGNNPLPVELLAFEASSLGAEVLLNWSTATETNNDFFTVERSDDGINFDVIGRVGGKGTVKSVSEYRFIDRNPVLGTAYYRLSQTDYDGTTEVLGTRAVRFSPGQSGLSLYPNPLAGDQLSLRASGLEKGRVVSFRVSDIAGRQVYSADFTPEQEYLSRELDLNGSLRAGLYMVELRQGNQRYTEKLIVP